MDVSKRPLLPNSAKHALLFKIKHTGTRAIDFSALLMKLLKWDENKNSAAQLGLVQAGHPEEGKEVDDEE